MTDRQRPDGLFTAAGAFGSDRWIGNGRRDWNRGCAVAQRRRRAGPDPLRRLEGCADWQPRRVDGDDTRCDGRLLERDAASNTTTTLGRRSTATGADHWAKLLMRHRLCPDYIRLPSDK